MEAIPPYNIWYQWSGRTDSNRRPSGPKPFYLATKNHPNRRYSWISRNLSRAISYIKCLFMSIDGHKLGTLKSGPSNE